MFPPDASTDAIEAIRGYVSAVSHQPGMLDGEGEYRFYYLCDVEQGRLSHGPRINMPGPIHGYVYLRDLIARLPIVNVIEICASQTSE